MESDSQYFARRAAAEREAAMKATHPGARQAHLQLANRYDEMASATRSIARGAGTPMEGTETG